MKKFNQFESNICALWVYPLLLIIAFFAVYSQTFDAKIFLGGDNAFYYILAKAIASGEGYTNILYSSASPATHFPPGYSFILSFFMLFTKSISFMKCVNGAFLLGSILLLNRIFYRLSKNRFLSFAVSFLVLINFHILQYSIVMMSEIPFLFVSMASLYFLMKMNADIVWYRDQNFYFLILGIAASYYIRSQGIALLGGILFFFLLKKQWRQILAITLGFFLLVFPWYLRGRSLGKGSYLNQLIQKNPYRPELGLMELSDWFDRIWANILRYVGKEFPSAFFPTIHLTPKVNPEYYHYLLGLTIICFVIFGLWSINEKRTVLIGYLGGQFAIQLLWPEVWFGVRFMLPVVPILIFLGFYGFATAIRLLFTLKKNTLKSKSETKLAMGIPLLMLVVFSYLIFPRVQKLSETSKLSYAKKYKNYFRLADWAKKNTPKDAVISCRKPALFHLYSNRLVHSFKNSKDQQVIIDDFIKQGVDYVVLDRMGYSSTGRYLLPAMKAFPRKFENVCMLKDPDTYLWKFTPEYGYFGSLKDGKYDGSGELRLKNGDVYKGNFDQNLRSGEGTFTWKNGQFWRGQWQKDKRHGKGEMVYPNGQKIVGLWEEDAAKGSMKIYSPTGEFLRSVPAESIFTESQKRN